MGSISQHVVLKNTFVHDTSRAGAPHADELGSAMLRRVRSDPTLGARVPLDVEMPAAPTPPAAALAPAGQRSEAEADLGDRAPEPGHGQDTPGQTRTANEVLEAAFQRLPDLSTEAVTEALHAAARRLPASAHEPFSSEVLPALLQALHHGIQELRAPRQLSQLAWALGKMGSRANPSCPLPQFGVEECMLHVCRLLPDALAECTHLELTNTLWGLARLYPGAASGAAGNVPQVRKAAHAILGGCAAKMPAFTSQRLSNTFWAMARLQMSGPGVEEFVAGALHSLSGGALLGSLTSQGVANVLWAMATLRVAGVGKSPQDGNVRLALVALSKCIAPRLQGYQPQELSMVAWSLAKLYEPPRGAGPQGSRRSGGRPAEVDGMLLSLAEVAAWNVDSFEAQGISNIAWALATLELTGWAPEMAPARNFFEAAMHVGIGRLGSYSSQAIANLLWACVRVKFPDINKKAKKFIGQFCSAVAEEMVVRTTGGLEGVTWRDLSGVAVALMHSKKRSPAVLSYMNFLVYRTTEQAEEGALSPQQILNIAQAAARMQVPRESMQQLVDTIESQLLTGRLHFNDLDWQQWHGVQQWCPPTRACIGETAAHQQQWCPPTGFYIEDAGAHQQQWCPPTRVYLGDVAHQQPWCISGNNVYRAAVQLQ